MLILENGDSDNIPGGSAGRSKRLLRLHKHIGHILHRCYLYLFLAEDGEMKHDLKRVGICSDDDEFGDASIECLGGLIGALLDLLQRGALGNEVE